MNYFCGTCGGLVDVIGMQPRDVRLCDCKKRAAELRKRISEMESRISALEGASQEQEKGE